MLVLTRKEGEALMIGDQVRLTVLSVKGGQVRVGIEAPRDVEINREELLNGSLDKESEPASGMRLAIES